MQNKISSAIYLLILTFSQGTYGMEQNRDIYDIYCAISAGNLELVKQFIQAGVDINALRSDAFYTGPLHAAAIRGRPMDDIFNDDAADRRNSQITIEIVKCLIRNGANIHVEGRGMLGTAFKMAHSYGRPEVAAFLENYSKWEQEAKTNPTHALLQEFIQEGYCDIVKLILKGNKVHPIKNDIALAQAQWLKTRDPIYKKIGRILVAYYELWDFLMKQVGPRLTEAQLPKELIELIYNSCD
jgi:hypothetical protein